MMYVYKIKICYTFVHSDSLQKLIQKTMVLWAEETFISSPDLVREMFSLLHRQYAGIGEVSFCLCSIYHSIDDYM